MVATAEQLRTNAERGQHPRFGRCLLSSAGSVVDWVLPLRRRGADRRWLVELGQEPSGFAAGDVNLYRYVDNQPTYATDPTGLYEGGSTGVGNSWHRLNHDPVSGTGTPQLMQQPAHEATFPHLGGVAEFEASTGAEYTR